MKLLPLLFAVLFLSPAHARERSSITVGFNPAETTALVEANGRRLSEYLKKKTGLEVKSFVAKDYVALVDALKLGKVDFAFLPPYSFIKAEELADAKLLLKAVRRGHAVYYGALVVRADSGFERIEDLKGKSIAWVDPSSATGYLIPKSELISRKKIDPAKFFGKQSFLGTHDALVQAVFQKKVDVGATWVIDPDGKNGAWQLYLHKPEERDQLKMIYVSEPVAGDALSTTQQLWKQERAMVDKVTKALQRMGEAVDGQQILRDLYGIDQMVPATAKDYASVRAAAKVVDPK